MLCSGEWNDKCNITEIFYQEMKPCICHDTYTPYNCFVTRDQSKPNLYLSQEIQCYQYVWPVINNEINMGRYTYIHPTFLLFHSP